MAYLLDSDVFIQAKNLHYGFDFCPAFWDWLVTAHEAGKVLSIAAVADELDAGDDDLTVWANARGPAFFPQPDAAVVGAFATVSEWTSNQHYEPAAINTFLQVADYYLVSHALAHGHTIVTHEVSAPLAKKVKIPNVCIGVGVPCINPYAMLRKEKARFVLGKRST